MTPTVLNAPDVPALVAITDNTALFGDIDPVGGIGPAKVFVYSGTQDSVVNRLVVDSLVSYYKAFLDPTQGGNLTTGTVTHDHIV
jgi:hypothetical protein